MDNKYSHIEMIEYWSRTFGRARIGKGQESFLQLYPQIQRERNWD
jgi:hypothetical protein